MRILSIETSCDETAISLLDASGGLLSPTFSVLGNSLISQINIHKEYGGVFPMLAKREHARNLPTLLNEALRQAGLIYNLQFTISKQNFEEKEKEIKKILEKERGLFENFKDALDKLKKPEIDVIAVTNGPGLAPALWVGISFAVALGKLWNIPVIPVNHMEGHITSVLMNKTEEFSISNFQFLNKPNQVQFPALALLISGGHTELVEIKNWGEYKIIGETKDDAVGEAFDKVARMLGLPYPGGPEISRLAEYAREINLPTKAKFPRPMLHSQDLNFSFSGLKTSVLYYIRDNFPEINNEKANMTKDDCADIAREFEDSVIDVLKTKTLEALEETNAKTLIIAGGVVANKRIREAFLDLEKTHNDLKLMIPSSSMSTDNAIMIGMAAYMRLSLNPELIEKTDNITAEGNMKLSR